MPTLRYLGEVVLPMLFTRFVVHIITITITRNISIIHNIHIGTRVEAPITNHQKDLVLDTEKYKTMQIFPTWEDRSHMNCNFFNNLFLKPKVGPNIIPMSWVCHNHSFKLLTTPHFSTQDRDMHHTTIDSSMIKIQSQPNQNSSTL